MSAGVGIEQKLIGIEAVPGIWIISTVNAVTIDGAGTDVREIAMPDLVGVLGKLDTIELAATGLVKDSNFDFCGVGGKKRKIGAATVPGSASRVG